MKKPKKSSRAKKNSILTVKIRSKQYKLVIKPKLDRKDTSWGYVNNPYSINKKLSLCSKMKGEKEMEIIIHECLHACFWDMSEEAVTESAKDIGKVLWRMGYRKVASKFNKYPQNKIQKPNKKSKKNQRLRKK